MGQDSGASAICGPEMMIMGSSSTTVVLHRKPGGQPPVQGSLDESDEQRVRPGGPGLQLGMGLGGHEIGVHLVRQLDELDQRGVRRVQSSQPGVLQRAR